MSVAKRLQHAGMSFDEYRRRGNRNRSLRGNKGFLSVEIKDDFARINKILSVLDQQMQFAAYDKALPAAGEVVAKRAKENAPRSSENVKGGREKMSAKAKAEWSPEPLADMIIVKRRKGKSARNNPYVLVGPNFPEGNKANFVSPMVENVRAVKLWGHDPSDESKLPNPARKDNDFLKRAADETIPQQLTAFLRALIPEVRRRLKGLANGK